VGCDLDFCNKIKYLFYFQNLCLNNNCDPFILIGHKFGCPVAIEMTLQLQQNDLDLVKHLVCIEGSQKFVLCGQEECVGGEEDCSDTMYKSGLLSFLDAYGVSLDEVCSNVVR